MRERERERKERERETLVHGKEGRRGRKLKFSTEKHKCVRER